MNISYTKKGDQLYAYIRSSIRNGNKVNNIYEGNLGLVLDKERNIFKNKERGVFMYDNETNTYKNAPVEFVPPSFGKTREQLILDFGDAFFINQYINQLKLCPVIDAIGYGNPDTLYAMICYYILSNMANCHAEIWWEGSYARLLYPKANLTSQRISDFLAEIGEESSIRSFFSQYFQWLINLKLDISNVLIDSTGCPNSIRFHLTAISNHNGEINNEVRLIYVVHPSTGMPIYFRYCPGNVIDTSTLSRCIAELKAQGVNVNHAILDAGYSTKENIGQLFDDKISFITRMKENLVQYKELVKEHVGSLMQGKNLVEYNGRYVYLKCVDWNMEDNHGYAYVGIDLTRKHLEEQKTFRHAIDDGLSPIAVHEAMKAQGVFILISSRRIAPKNLLPLYYLREQVEQVFDISKNYSNLLPVRCHTEETFRGHLLLTFISTILYKKLQLATANTKITPASLFLELRNLKCKVFDDIIITSEVFKKANDCYKLFKMKVPVSILR